MTNAYDWNALAEKWSATRPHALWRRHADSVYVDLLARWLPAAMQTVLKTDAFDEAFSAGVYPELAGRTRAVVTMDVAPTALALARERYRELRCACADVRALPFANLSFDAVVSLSTLDHFDSRAETEAALGELARVLRPGGTFLLTLDNLTNPIIALRAVLPFRLLHALGIIPYQIGWTCGPKRLRRMVARAGLEVIETSAIIHCPRVLAVAVAGVLDRSGNAKLKRAFVRGLGAMEWLRGLPTRFVTGHFVAVLAVKPHHPGR